MIFILLILSIQLYTFLQATKSSQSLQSQAFITMRSSSLLSIAATGLVALVSMVEAGVYVKYCEHKDFGGNCITIENAEVGRCYNVPTNMNDKVSSNNSISSI